MKCPKVWFREPPWDLSRLCSHIEHKQKSRVWQFGACSSNSLQMTLPASRISDMIPEDHRIPAKSSSCLPVYQSCHIVRLRAWQREFECQLLPPELPELSVLIKSLARTLPCIPCILLHSMIIWYDIIPYH